MSHRLKRLFGTTTLLAVCLTSISFAAEDSQGFKPLFNGKNLSGWDGNPEFWSVTDGVITGKTTKEKRTQGNTFLIWRQGELDDFELRLQFRIVGGNSGIQYRSREIDKWVVGGYQADFDGAGNWTGTLYEERGRSILAKRGNKVVIDEKGKKKKTGETTSEKDILEAVKKEAWNEYTIIARGNRLVQKINGKVTIDVTDEQVSARKMSGLLALQLHAGPPMLVQFKDIQLKRLPLENRKKVVFVAGKRSHGYGAHEHYAGYKILGKRLNESMPQLLTTYYRDGWPKDPTAFDNADVVMMFCTGGGAHMVNNHLDSFDKVMERGVGLGCIHYGVEVPAGKPGHHFLKWIGGYFEAHWSVNPHWTAEFKEFVKHPITRGVRPFSVNDEWYYHMRFRDNMEGVTQILTAIPPKETLSRPDGPHSGNKYVRAKIGQQQHVAWAADRPDGGRGFGFTGAHYHRNWADDNFRKTVLNAIVWLAKEEVPEGGVSSETPTQEELELNQDYPKPQPKKKKTTALPQRGAKAIFTSKTITSENPSVRIDVDITGAKQLFLVVKDAGNGISCDWADWAEPRLVGPAGEKKLTELKWKSASSDFGQVRINRNTGTGALMIGGRSVAYGIGTHSNSVISYDLPSGFTRFKALGGLDNGGTDQGACGESASVQFQVFTQKPPASLVRSSRGSNNESREPVDAVAGLDVAEGLEATLFASEPMILSLTNLDIDHRGRVWVCESVNYRRHAGKRKEGDRILILEDTNGDGKADKQKVYYQGNDVDSALGICVLGNRVIVSCAPNVFIFTDTDGDDEPDKKEILFSGISGAQHDHTVHAFIFGPDGKLYFNFGNEGRQLKDKHGKPIVDLAGNEVNNRRNPYQQGMVFRCNLDGSELETLGWNFRNNYEVTIDSFGTLWQSDNDDDGNRGVRINYVMEYGNYGYVDELDGSGWRSPRTGMHEEIPLRHWHLRDPGVVPNLLQTGAGSPTGILVYEGKLLPKILRNQVIHCDAGPNVTRAYPVKKDGAGYKAESYNILYGARDRWFRPSDVCVAPDGSLIVSDWYDPGVGGHAMGDLDRGRLFRVAPKERKYGIPSFDFSTVRGAIKALKNPNLSVRYLAWTSLHEMGTRAEPALIRLYNSKNVRYRARALWLLSKIKGRGIKHIETSLKDKNPNLRITALRAARQLDVDILSYVEGLINDRSPQVRRECAIALRHNKSPRAAELWAELAKKHRGKDRWYLESLGISADKQWDRFLESWFTKVGSRWNTPAGRDIIWRSRSKKSPQYLAKIINDTSTPTDQLPRYFRAFDFLDSPTKQDTLAALAFSPSKGDAARYRYIVKESVKRLDDIDLNQNPRYSAALEEILEQLRGTSEFINVVNKFQVEKSYPELLKLAYGKPNEQLGVEAIRALLSRGQLAMIQRSLENKNLELALATVQALGNSADGKIDQLLWPLIEDEKRDDQLRRQAARSLAKTRSGAQKLIKLAQDDKLEESLRYAAALPLSMAPWRDIRSQASKLFPLPAAKNNKPLPPLAQLLRMRGNVERGKAVYSKEGTCANCHVINGKGKEVGPNLSEIGSKLSREAFFESILYPSAGISHNYESYSLALESGNVVTGVMTSQTPESITIVSSDAISRTFLRSDIADIKKQKISIMPADLQKQMSAEDLADVVAYLVTLKKVQNSQNDGK